MLQIPRTRRFMICNFSKTLFIDENGRMNWAGNISHIGDVRSTCTFLVGKPQGKVSVWWPGRTWVVEIKVGLGK